MVYYTGFLTQWGKIHTTFLLSGGMRQSVQKMLLVVLHENWVILERTLCVGVSVVFLDVMNWLIFYTYILRFGIKQTNISRYRSAHLWLLALKNMIIVLLQMILPCFDIVMCTHSVSSSTTNWDPKQQNDDMY